MRQKGTEKDRIVGKNIIEGRRTDGNRRRRTENVREQNLRNREDIVVAVACIGNDRENPSLS